MEIRDEASILKEDDVKKKKPGQNLEFHVNDELRQVFVGHHTLFSVLGFTTGGILIGGSLEKILHLHIGMPMTILVGLILLFVSGLILHQFNG